MGFTLVSYKDSTPLGGGVFLTFKKKIQYKYSASDKRYKLLCPNHAFLWNAIQRGIAGGYSSIDFGRTDKNNKGLRRFKSGWGAKEEELSYTILAKRPPKNGSLALEKIAGVVIRNSPKYVCALSGELLYKHFA
jgi:lipid II:glycine glycyltransferase (peptidoglycan interpeptide bridge formation enzyme)